MATTDAVDHAPATEWDGQAEIAVGLFIKRHLAAHRPPDGAVCAADLEEWADRLLHSGQRRLAALENEAVA